MKERTVRVGSASGLHARPAAIFSKAAGSKAIKVQIEKDGRSVDASSILMLISLGAKLGDEVTLRAEGEDADAVLDELAELLEKNLDEETA